MIRARAIVALVLGATLLSGPAAKAAGPPVIAETWVEEVHANSAKLWAKIAANGFQTTYRFEYVTQSAFEKTGYATASKAPPSGAFSLGAGNSLLTLSQSLTPPLHQLTPDTAYRYRAVATNSQGTTTSPEHVFFTQVTAPSFKLPDNRGWEMVSPPEKGGGAIAAPGEIYGGGLFQAAPGGGAITYSSATAFGADAKGAPPASQYLSRRGASGWSTQNVSAPLESESYGPKPDGAPYRLFSTDLAKALLFGGLPCRGDLPGCPSPTPVLPGTGAQAGFMAYYLRDQGTNAYSSLLSPTDLSHTTVSAEALEVSFAASSPDLSHVVLSSCAALTSNATEALLGPGECDPAKQSLYEKSGSTALKLINLLPAQTTGTPGAAIAAPIGAISENGSRVYFAHEGDLHLRDGATTTLVAEEASFQAASTDGGVAYFLKEGHLHRFIAQTKATTDLTPSGGVVGVLGASSDGSSAYYQDAVGIKRWKEGTTTTVATGSKAALESDYPPWSATARVSPNGEHLLFLSDQELSGYDNRDASSPKADPELFLYGPLTQGGPSQLHCVSCNPTGERPQGPTSIPGALINGSTLAYRPRVLSSNSRRVYFDTEDELAPGDSNSRQDVYQWEAQGEGDCNRPKGCISMLSRGFNGKSTLLDASQDGSEVFFLTDESLVGADPSAADVYVARSSGGFPEAPKPIPCIADACQPLPPTPEDPDPGTLVPSSGNPELRFETERKGEGKKPKKGKGKKKKPKKPKSHFGKGKYHVPVKRGR